MVGAHRTGGAKGEEEEGSDIYVRTGGPGGGGVRVEEAIMTTLTNRFGESTANRFDRYDVLPEICAHAVIDCVRLIARVRQPGRNE